MSEQDGDGTEQVYCAACREHVEPVGASDACPVGGWDHLTYSSKEEFIETEHGLARIATGKGVN